MTDGVLTAEARLEQFLHWLIEQRELEREEAKKFPNQDEVHVLNRAVHVGRASMCSDVMAELSRWRSHDRAEDVGLVQELERIIAGWRQSASESDRAGDFCCAITRERDADILDTALSRWRSAHGSREAVDTNTSIV